MEYAVERLEKQSFNSGLLSALCLFVAVGAGFTLLAFDGADPYGIVVGIAIASAILMFVFLSRMEQAGAVLANHWSTVLGGTTWRTLAGETVTCRSANQYGNGMYCRFEDGFATLLFMDDLDPVDTRGFVVPEKQVRRSREALLLKVSGERWVTPDGRKGIVRKLEIAHDDDSSDGIPHLVLKLEDGETRTYRLDILKAAR